MRILLTLILSVSLQPVLAQKTIALKLTEDAIHISDIVSDTIYVASGTTYAFTVDTPEDKGLISTRPTAQQIMRELRVDGSGEVLQVEDKEGSVKTVAGVETGDRLIVTSPDGKQSSVYQLVIRQKALSGRLRIERERITVNTTNDIVLYFTAGQRSPNTTVRIFLPEGIDVSADNTTVNVIGRGDVKLKQLATQSMGRLGTNYPYKKVGNFSISKNPAGGSIILFKHLDLRPANGHDLKIRISNQRLAKVGSYSFRAIYETKEPEVLSSAGTGNETASLVVTQSISDFERVVESSLHYIEIPTTYAKVNFKWSAANANGIKIMQSLDDGKTWVMTAARIDTKNSSVSVSDLHANKLYRFKLEASGGSNQGMSNSVEFYTGKMDIKDFGVSGDPKEDATDKINTAIAYLNSIGGGTLLFPPGVYSVRTIHLQSNVYLYVTKDATIKALKGGDAPEATWFSDKQYRSGLSPTDSGPYQNPENWLTKQDVGHHYFRNAMFFGERLDNVKIIGNGRITGDGNLVTGDKVMNNAADNRCDKMFSLKLCTNIEIGGLYRSDDLWYNEQKDEPYYISGNSSIDNMLHIDRPGHFALLATGTDHINVHDTYFGRSSTSNTRDICDFMQCNDVSATNIYCKLSSDDIIKPGSDCSLGFTRPSKKIRVRNIIGDTNCNLFQIGSETADDISNVCVDNIYVLGANKAGFSISTNDGGHISDIHLNCGHTGRLHSRSKMFRTTTPFFISISNRGRVLGAVASRFKFDENGVKHDELLITNISIGQVENIILNGIDIAQVYGGSSFGDASKRWESYNGKQRRATPIVAGYALPDPGAVEGGLNFTLPNGKYTGYVSNIVFNDVHILVKGGNPASDTAAAPPELGVGQYNVSNLQVQPSYGLWARHVMGLHVTNSSFNYENPDGRYAIFLDDVVGANISRVTVENSNHLKTRVKLKNSKDVGIENATGASSSVLINRAGGNTSSHAVDLKSALMPAVKNGGFKRPGYILWCPTVIKVGKTYHMFASSWPEQYGLGGWTIYSEIIRATSDNLYGPYTFAEVVIQKREGYWDNDRAHNPKIVKAGNKFVLFYISSANETGYAYADAITGPWTRSDSAAMPFSNPAPLIMNDGKVYVFGRKAEGKVRIAQAYRATAFNHQYKLVSTNFNLLPDSNQLEDPTIWWASGNYNVLLSDFNGDATGVKKAGAHYWSKNGIDYKLVSPEPVYTKTLVYDDGSSTTFRRRERPFVYVDEKGKVTALFTACLVQKEDGSEQSWIEVQPVDNYVPPQFHDRRFKD